MTKEEFLAYVARLDRTQGNYLGTLLPKNVARRNELLWRVDDNFISLFKYLIDEGFAVYVHEILRKRRRGKHKNGRLLKQFAHIWLPQLNLAIRFSPAPTNDGSDIRVKSFIYTSRPNIFCCVVHSEDDAVSKIREAIPRIREYKKRTPRLGVIHEIIKPQPKKKRARIVTSEKI